MIWSARRPRRQLAPRGTIGAVAGGFIMRTLDFAGQAGMHYAIITAAVGAVILTLLFRLIGSLIA